ncbi:MAG: CRISPR-associated helicase Cas3' [Parabacteroides sp.]|nr:CRISPR-associated helicase Cas3' [Parabacteroides sp.]
MQVFDKQFFLDLIPVCDSYPYYAHLPEENQQGRTPELLSEHSVLVVKYAQQIAEAHNLAPVIKKLIIDSIPEKSGNKEQLAETMARLFWRAFAFHDLGKINHGFQYHKMKNRVDKMLKVDHPFQNQHSILSVYLFLALFFQDFLNLIPVLTTQITERKKGTEIKKELEKEQIFLCNIALYLSYPIYKHHSPVINDAQDTTNWSNNELVSLKPYLTLLNHHLTEEGIEQFHSCFLDNADFSFLFKHFNHTIDFIPEKNAFPLFALIKLNYSILTAADYLATAHYMGDWPEMLTDFGILNEGLKEKIVHNAQTSKSYNKEVYAAMASGKTGNPEDYTVQSNENLNALRRCLATEVISNIRKNSDKCLFYIEAPTGSGKTNVSMLALAELLKIDSSIQKAFYVFPFTTLITQTYQSLAGTFGLEESEIAEIHSKAPLSKRFSRENDLPGKRVARPAAPLTNRNDENSDYLNYLDHLFMNYPVALLSHVRFFEVLKTNEKETNYLLHRLANSVVIIDEIQSYPPNLWDKIVYFIANYASYFHIKFIVMSATLPKIGDLLDRKEWANDFVYLVENKNKYFRNPNFCNRVLFDYSLLNPEEWPKPPKGVIPVYLEKLCKEVFEKSIAYAETNTTYPDSVFTLVEFIFKKTAGEFYSIANRTNGFFDEILLLSGTIVEPRRKQIIDKLKSKDTRKKKILLITTQVVEAGVDIDMDLGFKDKSIIDSEEQLAGRINRNVNKPVCRLYLFDCDMEKMLYGKDYRYRLMCEMPDEYKKILQEKDFDKLYRAILEKIKGKKNSAYTENITDVFNAMGTLNFSGVNKLFKLIDQESKSIFVPLEIPVALIPQHINTLTELGIPYSHVVNGADVWKKYAELITEQSENFIKKQVDLKKFQSVLSVFIFSVFPNGKDYNVLKTYGEEKFGFLYLENFSEVYSFENGIKAEKFPDSNFL